MMRKLMMVLGLTFLVNSSSWSQGYFVIPGQAGYVRQILQEACFLPTGGIGETTACTSLPLIEHPASRGYLIIPGEDWSPLTVGGAFGAPGTPMLTFGIAFNLAPTLKAMLLGLINRTTDPHNFQNVKSLLAPPDTTSKVDMTVNIGTKWGLLPGRNWKGEWIMSVGPALQF